ncbi:MAG: hypothetical protein KAJ60_03335 [Desulfobulbaceae bacterium]|nr:hypothetical protein [Desulfobulbaceae bacterium]MCK5403861.1 hypothetical protein [Desulfobulbaceae bacterium]
MTKKSKSKNLLLYNIIFLGCCIGIFLFLWNAPPETTPKLPHDDEHNRFFEMPKKVAEKECDACHSSDGDVPRPENHPPKYRCLFCHKKN